MTRILRLPLCVALASILTSCVEGGGGPDWVEFYEIKGDIDGWSSLNLGLDGQALLSFCTSGPCQRIRVQAVKGDLRCVQLDPGPWFCGAKTGQQERVSFTGPEFPDNDPVIVGVAIETSLGAKAAVFREVARPATSWTNFTIHNDAAGLRIE